MFTTRLISGIVLVLLLLLFIIPGGDILLLGLLAISLIGLFELYRVYKMEKELPAFVGYLSTIIFYANLRFPFIPDTMMFVLGFFILLMFVYVFTYPKYKTEQILASFMGVFYVGVMLSYIYQTRMISNGAYVVWLIFLCSWGCDTCAYCMGVLFGKHKMAPILSPKKSIEGAVGGVLGSAILTAIYATVLRTTMDITSKEVITLAIISMVAAFISMIGDLTASAIKRNYGMKDYGKLIPGHGGVLDRFDSVIFTAPMIYFLATIVI